MPHKINVMVIILRITTFRCIATSSSSRSRCIMRSIMLAIRTDIGGFFVISAIRPAQRASTPVRRPHVNNNEITENILMLSWRYNTCASYDVIATAVASQTVAARKGTTADWPRRRPRHRPSWDPGTNPGE